MLTSIERRCATCRFWIRQGPEIANATRDPRCPKDEGTCQARSPTPVSIAASGHPAGGHWSVPLFPRTHESRGCGEWKPRHSAGPDDGERDEVVTPFRKVAA